MEKPNLLSHDRIIMDSTHVFGIMKPTGENLEALDKAQKETIQIWVSNRKELAKKLAELNATAKLKYKYGIDTDKAETFLYHICKAFDESVVNAHFFPTIYPFIFETEDRNLWIIVAPRVDDLLEGKWLQEK